MYFDRKNPLLLLNGLSDHMKYQMHRDRYLQFCKRLRWDLPLARDSIEIDQYDDCFTSYVVVSDGANHLGSFRLREVKYGTMIGNNFRSFLPRSSEIIEENRTELCEITRFVCKPGLANLTRIMILKTLLNGFEQAMKIIRCEKAIGVVFPSIFKIMCRNGLNALEIERGNISGESVVSFSIKAQNRGSQFAETMAKDTSLMLHIIPSRVCHAPDIGFSRPPLCGKVGE